MKLGTENRKELVILLLLAVVALYAGGRMYFGKPTVAANTPVASATPATSTAKKPPPTTTTRKYKQRTPLVASLDPTLRFDLLKSSEDQEYKGGERNIFNEQAPEIPQPKFPPVKPGPSVPQPPPGPPPPPPINLKFYGFASRPGEPKRVFLSTGDDVLIGSEGEIVNRRYRIVHITNSSVEIEDVLNNNKQVIPLTQG
jgi:hypothetical protein